MWLTSLYTMHRNTSADVLDHAPLALLALLALLPPDMWLLIMCYFQRSCWAVEGHSGSGSAGKAKVNAPS